MSQSNEELAEELKDLLIGQSGLTTAFAGDEPADEPMENPLETDFFKAVNAFRAARSAGTADELAAAEERLRAVVRAELTGESCEA